MGAVKGVADPGLRKIVKLRGKEVKIWLGKKLIKTCLELAK